LVNDPEAFPKRRQFSCLINIYAKEYIWATIVWPNESEPFLSIKPLYGTCGHFDVLAGQDGLASQIQ
jgi:hypothetical protein